jgi:hypothetical protein
MILFQKQQYNKICTYGLMVMRLPFVTNAYTFDNKSSLVRFGIKTSNLQFHDYKTTQVLKMLEYLYIVKSKKIRNS